MFSISHWALEHFKTLLEGHKYTIITDHAALTYIKNTTHTKQRMHRLVLKLQLYELSIEYKPGVKHYAADLLSRSTHMEHINNNAMNTTLKSRSNLKKKAISKREYEVEKIINRRSIKGRELDKEYLVKWVGYKDPTWKPLSNLINAMDRVVKYELLLLNKQQDKVIQEKQKESDKSKKDNDKQIEDKLILKINERIKMINRECLEASIKENMFV